MARYKQCNHHQLKLLPISFSRQIFPGTFEYTLSHIAQYRARCDSGSQSYTDGDSRYSAWRPIGRKRLILAGSRGDAAFYRG